MERYAKELKKIKNNLKRNRDHEIRRRARFLIHVMESKNVRLGCCRLGLCPKTFYAWLKRLKKADYEISALKNKSRKPKTSPRQIKQELSHKLLEIRKRTGDTGGHIVAYCLHSETGIRLSHSGIDKVFRRYGVTGRYRTKKANPHKRRYASKKPLDRVQSDSLWTGIEDNHGNRVYTVNMVDCHSRLAFAHCALDKSGYSACEALKQFLKELGKPKCVQTDNGVEFTNRYISELHPKRQKASRPSAFYMILEKNQIRHALIRPRTPAHNGKVERFNQTLLRFVRSADLAGKDMETINTKIQGFIDFYNQIRPHTSLNGLTPAQAFQKHTPIRAA